MHEMIAARRAADVKEERHDLFSSLLDANEGLAATGEKLPDAGLMGNVFIFMVAGAFLSDLPHEHECTPSRTPCADGRALAFFCRLRGTFPGVWNFG